MTCERCENGTSEPEHPCDACALRIEDTKMVICIRTDLNMRKGKMAAQAAHAAMGFLTDALSEPDAEGAATLTLTAVEWDWVQTIFTKICVGVASEAELDDVVERARAAGVRVQVVTDVGRTEFGGVPTRTCCAVGPDVVSRVDTVTKGLRLL